tara:strand:- start:232 stop:909 length:678 start_codon:yes stop_codon:yes gene_type:complete
MEEKIVKKRGRKSKTAIVAKNVDIDYEKYNENKIIHVRYDTKMTNENEKNKIETIDKVVYSNVDSTRTYDCWNCSEKINNLIGYPIYYDKKVFYCYGDFCSFACCGRYITDKYSNQELYDKLNLLNNMYNKANNTINKMVDIAPDRRLLNKFGGNMTIQEYRDEIYKDNHYNITIPPIIPVNHTVVNLGTTSIINNSQEELRLYRKNNNINIHNDILDSMKVSVS